MKIAVATNDKTSVNREFARALFFALYDDSGKTFDFLDNSESQNAAHGAGIMAANTLKKNSVDAVLAFQLGPKALDGLKTNGIKIFRVNAGVALTEAVKMYEEGKLGEY